MCFTMRYFGMFVFLVFACSCEDLCPQYIINRNRLFKFGCKPRPRAYVTVNIFEDDSNAKNYDPEVTVLHRCEFGYCSMGKKCMINETSDDPIVYRIKYSSGEYVTKTAVNHISCVCK